MADIEGERAEGSRQAASTVPYRAYRSPLAASRLQPALSHKPTPKIPWTVCKGGFIPIEETYEDALRRQTRDEVDTDSLSPPIL